MAETQRRWLFVPRHATRIDDGRLIDRRTLSAWRGEPHYVLLGEPGAGKSESLAQEAQAADARVIEAERILAGLEDPVSHEDTVFIDGLDQVTGAANGAATALQGIATWIKRSGHPRWRIACREAEWRQESARTLLAGPSDDAAIVELHLDPLDRDDMTSVLAEALGSPAAARAFLDKSPHANLDDWLGNPLMLRLTLEAFERRGGWPETRTAAYEDACENLVFEDNAKLLEQQPDRNAAIESLIDESGAICAVLLLSGRTHLALSNVRDDAVVKATDLSVIGLRQWQRALNTRIFQVAAKRAQPLHRTVAEFLAARYLAQLIQHKGLPLGRVLTLMCGHDGKPVSALRGLFGWLATHLHALERERLVGIDPLSIVLNGDAAALSTPQTMLVFESLASESRANPGLRWQQWASHPFGPLIRSDNYEALAAELAGSDYSLGRQAYLTCIVDAMQHAAQAWPRLTGPLQQLIENPLVGDSLRIGAYLAWKKHAPQSEHSVMQRKWLHAVGAGPLHDPNDELQGQLLEDSFPHAIGLEVLEHLEMRRNPHMIGTWRWFWSNTFLERTDPSMSAQLADAWIARHPNGLPEGVDSQVQETIGSLIWLAIQHHGDRIEVTRLYRWLGAGLDAHGVTDDAEDKSAAIAQWLAARPDLLKALASHGYASVPTDPNGNRHFWIAEQRLRRAQRPRDWLLWKMALAQRSNDPQFIRIVLFEASHAAMEPQPGVDAPTMEGVDAWAQSCKPVLPEIEVLLAESRRSRLDDWRGEDGRRRHRARAEREHERQMRKESYRPVLQRLSEGPPHWRLLHQVAMAYQDRFSNIAGASPEARVAELVGADEQTTGEVLAAVDAVWTRDDLPSTNTVLDLLDRQQRHYACAPIVLAAKRAMARDPNAWSSWTAAQAALAAACWLAFPDGEHPIWYQQLIWHRPEVMAPLLIRLNLRNFKGKEVASLNGLSPLADDARAAPLTRLVVPPLIERFPLRCSDSARAVLNRDLLRALPQLEPSQALELLNHRLSRTSLDVGQRIACLVAQLPMQSDALTKLVELIGRNQRRAAMLGDAVVEQKAAGRLYGSLEPKAVGNLIRILAPLTPYAPDWTGGWVSNDHRRERMLLALMDRLTEDGRPSATDVLHALANDSLLGHWQEAAHLRLQPQREVRREVEFKWATPPTVAAVLANRGPASPADLLALANAQLDEIVRELRQSPSFLLRQFYRDDSRTPQDEPMCRDILLDRLTHRFTPQQVEVTSETRAAGDKRMDLRLSAHTARGQLISLPIEAKKDSHSDLWFAWRDQLQRHYMGESSADRHGMYLVLWFGHKTQQLAGTEKVESAKTLEQRLVQRVPQDDRNRLAIKVLDLSWPDTIKRR